MPATNFCQVNNLQLNLGRDRIHQPQACASPKLQRNHNSSVLKILQTISFVFKILQIRWPVSGLFGRLCTNRYQGQGYQYTMIEAMSQPKTTAVLLLAHGTPDVLGEMAEYL